MTDLSQVTLSQMRYAVAVAELRNFRAAAERCTVSQSGSSMQIQKLEDLLGRALFDRSKKPVLMTSAGESAIAQMRVILRETQRLGQVTAEDREPSGSYRLGVIPTLSPTVLPLGLRTFVQQFPRVELIIEELETAQIIERLREDSIDAGLAATPLGVVGLNEQTLAGERMFAYLPPGDPWLRKKSVRQSELRDRALWVMPEGHCFRTRVLSYCNAESRPGPEQIRFESGNFATLIRLVDEGLGATILPELTAAGLSEARREAQLRPLTAPVPVREIGLVTARTDLRAGVRRALGGVFAEALAAVLQTPPKRSLVLDPWPTP